MEKEVHSLVSEYLTARGFLQTHAAFQTECQFRAKEGTPTLSSDLHSEFLVALECGERSAFFSLWDQHIPVALRDSDPTCQSLEFSLSVYFAVLPLRIGSGDAGHSMREFKSYLESRGAVLAQSEEFATYCALPYIPNPSLHPSFRTLFSDSWSVELKARLVQFLQLALPESEDSPRLVSLCLRNRHPQQHQGNVGRVEVLQRQLVETERQYMKRLAEIQSSYHTLVGIAMELVEALESAVAGRMITPEYVQGMCSRLFGTSLQQQQQQQQAVELQRPASSTSLLRASVMSLRESVQVPPTPSPLSPLPLDYLKIKAALTTGPVTSRALLIQALRWRLTRSLTEQQRSCVLSAYIENDILGCASSNSYQASVMRLFTSGGVLVREQLCRLFNTLSSLAGGRGYLAQCPAHLQALCGVMVEEEGDSHTRRNALGAVQKLSLRRPLQALMVEAGLLQWVVELLQDQSDALSEYTLRYSLALLMNLCLRSAGKRACVPFGSKALKVLGELLEHEDQEICSYVNGILYSLLSLSELREDAKAMGMGEMLTSALRAGPPELQSQLKYIIAQLNSEVKSSNEESEDEDEDDEEEDPDVIEGDEEDHLIDPSEPSGEDLLTREFLANDSCSMGALESTPLPAKKVSDVPYARPVTPQTFAGRPHTATTPCTVSSAQPKTETVRRSASSAS